MSSKLVRQILKKEKKKLARKEEQLKKQIGDSMRSTGAFRTSKNCKKLQKKLAKTQKARRSIYY